MREDPVCISPKVEAPLTTDHPRDLWGDSVMQPKRSPGYFSYRIAGLLTVVAFFAGWYGVDTQTPTALVVAVACTIGVLVLVGARGLLMIIGTWAVIYLLASCTS